MQQQTAALTLVDLNGVPYVDSAGLGSLVKFFVSYKRHGASSSSSLPPNRCNR